METNTNDYLEWDTFDASSLILPMELMTYYLYKLELEKKKNLQMEYIEEVNHYRKSLEKEVSPECLIKK